MSGLAGKATTGGGDYTLCPAGTHPAVLIGVIDLGTHWESFKGQPERKVRRVLLVWEVECEVDGKDTRLIVGRDYNISINDRGELFYGPKSALRQLLEGWRTKQFADGEEIDPSKALGQPCLLVVNHEKTSAGKDVSRVKSANKLLKGMAAVMPSQRLISYLADDQDRAAPADDWLPYVYGDRIDAVLKRCLEWGGDGRRKNASNGNDHAQANGANYEQYEVVDDGRTPFDLDIPY